MTHCIKVILLSQHGLPSSRKRYRIISESSKLLLFSEEYPSCRWPMAVAPVPRA